MVPNQNPVALWKSPVLDFHLQLPIAHGVMIGSCESTLGPVAVQQASVRYSVKCFLQVKKHTGF